MKTTQKNPIYILLIILITLLSCSKENGEFLYNKRMITVSISGYNASENTLEVKIDTFTVEQTIGRNNPINFGAAYTFSDDQKEIEMTITEKESGKIVLEKTLIKGSDPIKLSYLYLEGKLHDFPIIPPKEDGKIRVQYIYMPKNLEYKGPVDIAFGKYYLTPKVYVEFARLKNVKPFEVSESISFDTFSTVGQTYNGQPTATFFRAYLYKAGTNEFVTAGTSYNWNLLSSAVPVPSATSASSKFFIFSDYIYNNNIMFSKNLEL